MNRLKHFSFLRFLFLFVVLILFSFFVYITAFAQDEGTLGNNLFLNLIADSIYVIRFPTNDAALNYFIDLFFFAAIFEIILCLITNEPHQFKTKTMTNNPQQDLLTDEFLNENVVKRSSLLPIWIKVFAWIFIVLGVIAPFAFIAGLLGFRFQISLYGFETNVPTSMFGISLIILFIVKGITAFGLLKEKDWAIKSGLADAVIGIIICACVMLYQVYYFSSLSFRLELVALIPYFLKLRAIKEAWETSGISAVA